MARRPVLIWLGVVGAGIAFGAADRAIDNWASIGNDVANRSSFWLVGAFLAGAAFRSRRRSAVAGTAFLFAALAGFYGWMHFAEGQANADYLVSVAAKWAYGSLVVGPVLGLLGSSWRRGSRWAPTATGVVLIAEAVVWLLVSGVRTERVAVSLTEAAAGAVILVRTLRRPS